MPSIEGAGGELHAIADNIDTIVTGSMAAAFNRLVTAEGQGNAIDSEVDTLTGRFDSLKESYDSHFGDQLAAGDGVKSALSQLGRVAGRTSNAHLYEAAGTLSTCSVFLGGEQRNYDYATIFDEAKAALATVREALGKIASFHSSTVGRHNGLVAGLTDSAQNIRDGADEL